MALSLTSRPIVSGCNFNAAGNPIVYKFTREDTSINSIADAGGFAKIAIIGIDLTAYFNVGSSVYVKTTNNSNYDAIASVTAVSFGANTEVTTNLPYVGGGAGYINSVSKRTDYKIEVEIFKSSDNTSLTNGIKFTFSPNRSGVMNVDVSAIVKSFISAEWSNPVSLNEVDAQASIKFHIKYQEYYDGALQGSVTSDSANPIHAVFAAMQIGSANGQNMLAYYPADDTKLWLTKFALSSTLQKLVMWKDWPFDISFIHPDGIGNLYRRVLQYGADGVKITDPLDQLDLLSTANDDFINRLELPSIHDGAVRLLVSLLKGSAGSFETVDIPNPDFTGSSSPWQNFSTGTDWAYASDNVIVSLPSSSISKVFGVVANETLTDTSGGFLKLLIDIQIPNTKNVNLQLFAWNVSTLPGLIATLNNVIGNGSSAVQTITSTIRITDSNYTHFGFRVVSNDSVGGSIIVTEAEFQYAGPNKAISDIEVEIRDVCDYNSDNDLLPGRNPIHLLWKNSLGGDSFWNFQKYHEYTYTYQNGRKAKRIILFDNELHPVQWEALQELNGTGEVYQTNIVELTSSTNKTSQRVGQQVYMISQDGTKKTGVIVIPSTDRIFARDETDKIAIEIELPEVFQL